MKFAPANFRQKNTNRTVVFRTLIGLLLSIARKSVWCELNRSAIGAALTNCFRSLGVFFSFFLAFAYLSLIGSDFSS
jgi:hypothetical protein